MPFDLRGFSSETVFRSVSLELGASVHLNHFLLLVVEVTKFGHFLAKCLVS